MRYHSVHGAARAGNCEPLAPTELRVTSRRVRPRAIPNAMRNAARAGASDVLRAARALAGGGVLVFRFSCGSSSEIRSLRRRRSRAAACRCRPSSRSSPPRGAPETSASLPTVSARGRCAPRARGCVSRVRPPARGTAPSRSPSRPTTTRCRARRQSRLRISACRSARKAGAATSACLPRARDRGPSGRGTDGRSDDGQHTVPVDRRGRCAVDHDRGGARGQRNWRSHVSDRRRVRSPQTLSCRNI